MAALVTAAVPMTVAVKSVNVQEPLTMDCTVEPPKVQVAGELLTVAVTIMLMYGFVVPLPYWSVTVNAGLASKVPPLADGPASWV